MNVNDALNTVTSVANGIVGLGLSLVIVALVVDILFPGTTAIVGNVSALVSSFTSQGLVGLVTLIVFVAIASRWFNSRWPIGEIINEHDLVIALRDRIIAGAGLDVFQEEPYSGPLTNYENVILSPHIGSYAQEIRMTMELEAVNNLIEGLDTKWKK